MVAVKPGPPRATTCASGHGTRGDAAKGGSRPLRLALPAETSWSAETPWRGKDIEPSRLGLHLGPLAGLKADDGEPGGGKLAGQPAQVLGPALARELDGQTVHARIMTDEHEVLDVGADLADAREQAAGRRKVKAILELDRGIPCQLRQHQGQGLPCA